MEALTPPAQLSEWHLLNIENYRTIQAFVDLQPKDDVTNFILWFLIVGVSADSEEKLGEAAARLPEDVRQQMIEAACMDPEGLPYNYESVPDDHGNNIEIATRVAIGEVVAVELDNLENLDDREVFAFRARPGTGYVLTLDWETYQIWDNPGSIMDLYDAGGRLLARLNGYDFSEQRIRNKIMWQAVTGGDYYIAIGDGNTLGNFALTVTGGNVFEDNGSSRLARVRQRGTLICASRNDMPGFVYLDAAGNNVGFDGFDTDLCRAVATAVLGNPNAIEIRQITAAERGQRCSTAKSTCWCVLSAEPPPATLSGPATYRPCSMTARASWSKRASE